MINKTSLDKFFSHSDILLTRTAPPKIEDELEEATQFIHPIDLKNSDPFAYLLPFGIDIRSKASNPPDFEYYRDQILLIEEALKKNNFNDNEAKPIRIWVGNILNDSKLTSSCKMAEWGSLYAFLMLEERKIEIDYFIIKIKVPYTNPPSFFKIFRKQIVEKWNFLKETHRDFCPEDFQRAFPSGKVHSFLQTCCKIILPFEGKLNRGGIEAILICLSGDVGIFLRDEHRKQIYHVLFELLSNKYFAKLMVKKAECSHSLKRYVYYDLKLSMKNALTSLDIKRAALMALFFDLRQFDKEGNCYAVATLVNTIFNDPVCIFEEILTSLKKGTISSHVEIPLGFLLQFLPERKDDYHFKFLNAQIDELKIPSKICDRILEIPPVQQAQEEPLESVTLVNYFKKNLSFLPDSGEKDLKVLKDIFISYHKNWLQQILLLKLEFREVNYITKNEGIFDPFHDDFLNLSDDLGKRSLFFFHFFKKMDEFFKKFLKSIWVDETQYFFLELIKNCFDSISLIPALEPELDGGGNEIKSKYFKGKLPSDKEILDLCSSKVVFIYHKDKILTMINSFEEFVIYLKKEVDEAVSKLKSNPAIRLKALLKCIETYFESSSLRKTLLQLLTEINNQFGCKISNIQFESLGLPIIYLDGGIAKLILREGLNLNFSLVKGSRTNTTDQFIRSLTTQINKLCESTPTFFIERRPLLFTLISERFRHTFLTYPYKYLEFWFELTYDEAFHGLIMTPANKFLTSEVTIEQKKRIVRLMELDEQCVLAQSIVSFKKETWRTFRNRLSGILTSDQASMFENAINRVQKEFTINDFASIYFERLFFHFYPSAEKSIFEEVKKEITIRAKERKYFTPASFSYFFQKVCAINKLYLVEAFLIEKAICKLLKISMPINIGDLNYENILGERPIHQELHLVFNVFAEKVEFVQRVKINSYKLESLNDSNRYNFYIYSYP